MYNLVSAQCGFFCIRTYAIFVLELIFFLNKLHVELLKNSANIYCAALIWIAGTFCNINGLFDRFEILLTHIIPHWFLFITENNTLTKTSRYFGGQNRSTQSKSLYWQSNRHMVLGPIKTPIQFTPYLYWVNAKQFCITLLILTQRP